MVNRRQFLRAGVVAGAAGTAAVALPSVAGALPGAAASETSGSLRLVRPDDPQYVDLVSGMNARLRGRPEQIAMPTTGAQVAEAVREAVRNRKSLVVRSGGHCFEDHVFNDSARRLVDMSRMKSVGYDPARRAFWVDPGATLLEIYTALYNGWGVTLPGGGCHSVGAGGHFSGGGYGVLSRKHGLVIDHVHGVEMVTVGRDGDVRTVSATRDQGANAELAWAAAGGGGGNFGVTTRFWMRSPGTRDAPPEEQLPRPPREVLYAQVKWPWSAITREGFTSLVNQHGEWHRRNSAPGSPWTNLGHWLFLNHKSAGNLFMVAQMDATVAGADRMMTEFIGFLSNALGVQPDTTDVQRLPFLKATTYSTTGGETLTNPNLRTFHKSAFMKRPFPSRQVDVLWHHLTREDYKPTYSYLVLNSGGGQIGAVGGSDTPSAHRASTMLLFYESYWYSQQDDAANIDWIQRFYQDMYADTGGVPVPNDVTDGAYVNYPDRDLSDPRFNRSSTRWSTLYYGGNYERLQRVKAQWDPTNFFRHRHSVELPGAVPPPARSS